MRTGEQRRQMRQAAAMLLVALAGLAASILSGLALVPRVRTVDVLTVLAGGIGSGAAFVAAIVQFRAARATLRGSDVSEDS